MDFSLLATEMLTKTAALFKTSGPKQMHTFLQGEMFILHFISHQTDDVIPSEISTAMNASSARVAMALKTLESKGLVERRIDQTDRRKIIVSITEQGRSIIFSQQAEMREKVEEVLMELGEEDTKEYIRIVTRMLEISKRVLHEQPTQ